MHIEKHSFSVQFTVPVISFLDRYNHLKWLIVWPLFFIAFYAVENFITADKYYLMQCPIDNIIPFCEFFVVPYVIWYFYIAGMLIYLAFNNRELFVGMMKYIAFTSLAAIAIFILFPSCQNMRPAHFEANNIFTQTISQLYTIDTNTNVCPSLHVLFSVAVLSAALKLKKKSMLWKTAMTVLCVLICISTVFIKQHSVIDVVVALLLCIAAERICYKKKNRNF